MSLSNGTFTVTALPTPITCRSRWLYRVDNYTKIGRIGLELGNQATTSFNDIVWKLLAYPKNVVFIPPTWHPSELFCGLRLQENELSPRNNYFFAWLSIPQQSSESPSDLQSLQYLFFLDCRNRFLYSTGRIWHSFAKWSMEFETFVISTPVHVHWRAQ
jgi:hypothetical protein